MKNYIGTLLSFQEPEYNSTIRGFDRVLKAANEVGEAYKNLDTTFNFTQEVFEDIVCNGIKNISKKYADRIEEQIASSKFTSKAIINSMRENIIPELATFTNKINALHQARTVSNAGLSILPIDYEFIKIVDGVAVLTDESKEALKEIFSIKIRTEDQSKLYSLLVGMKEKYEALTTFMQEKGINIARWGNIITDRDNGLCYENNGKLEIDPQSINIKLQSNGSAVKQQLLDA